MTRSYVQENPLVELQNLSIAYSLEEKNELRAVENVNLTVYKGETLGLLGESGCGKTTLGMSLLSLLPRNGKVVSGSIKIGGTDVTLLRGEALRRYRWSKTAMVFQSAMNALDPVKTIEDQMIETIVQHTQISKNEARQQVFRLLEMVNIDKSRAKSHPHELSGGMRQRVVIAMALCLTPDLLIADEPTTALDVIVQAGILFTIRELQRRFGVTIILITHDISIMREMTDRIAVMYAGKIVEIGKTLDMIENPQHPYTQALIDAVPEIGKSQQKIKGIPGSQPNLIERPMGCRFNPRCKYAFQKCKMEEPPLLYRSGRQVACWLRE